MTVEELEAENRRLRDLVLQIAREIVEIVRAAKARRAAS